MDSGVAGLIGAAIGAGAVLIGQLLTLHHQRRLAQEEWTRNRLHEVYQGALAHLDDQARDRWLDTLLMYFPQSAHVELDPLLDRMRRGAVRRHDIVRLALLDERLGSGRARPPLPSRLPSYDASDPANQDHR